VEVQIFGTKKSADTRKAMRFFAERRVRVHFVDLAERAAALGELKRFAQKFGVDALVDRTGKRYAELGLRSAHYSEGRWLDELALEPLLLRTPLVRYQQRLTIGLDENAWKEWLATAAAQLSPRS
jgi:arsenate reductase